VRKVQSTAVRSRPARALPPENLIQRLGPPLSPQMVLGILREQGIPDSEARRRVESDPELSRRRDD
jgi:hypothetical protein